MGAASMKKKITVNVIIHMVLIILAVILSTIREKK